MCAISKRVSVRVVIVLVEENAINVTLAFMTIRVANTVLAIRSDPLKKFAIRQLVFVFAKKDMLEVVVINAQKHILVFRIAQNVRAMRSGLIVKFAILMENVFVSKTLVVLNVEIVRLDFINTPSVCPVLATIEDLMEFRVTTPEDVFVKKDLKVCQL
jgi:hypothetical protein